MYNPTIPEDLLQAYLMRPTALKGTFWIVSSGQLCKVTECTYDLDGNYRVHLTGILDFREHTLDRNTLLVSLPEIEAPEFFAPRGVSHSWYSPWNFIYGKVEDLRSTLYQVAYVGTHNIGLRLLNPIQDSEIIGISYYDLKKLRPASRAHAKFISDLEEALTNIGHNTQVNEHYNQALQSLRKPSIRQRRAPPVVAPELETSDEPPKSSSILESLLQEGKSNA